MHHREKDMSNALRSMAEEITAVNDYSRRLDEVTCPELIKIIEYIRSDEKEHIAMLVNWVAQRDTEFKEFMDRDSE